MAIFRATYSGVFAGGEEFTTGHYFTTTGNEDARDACEDLKDTYIQSPLAIEGFLGPDDELTKLTVYKYASLGTPAIDSAEQILGLEGLVPAGKLLPTQLAAVVTLRTGAPGGSRRGRMYLPMRGVPVLNTVGRLETSTQQDLATYVAAYFGAVNVFGIRSAVVASRTRGTTHQITSVDVGNVLDGQSRRKTGLTESRISVNVSQV